jgi:O-antigen/teichoic acid export membrane protein
VHNFERENRMSSIKKNYLYNTFYNILSILIPLITTPYIARVLGPEGVGTYSYTYSIAYYFAICIVLGLNKYGNRAISVAKENKKELSCIFCEIYTMQLAVGIFVVAVFASCSFFLFSQYRLIQIVQLLYVVSAVFDVSWFYFGIEEFRLTVIRNVIVRLANLALIFLLVHDSNDLVIYVFIMAGSTLVSQLSLWPILLKKYVTISVPKYNDVAKHVKGNVILFLPTIAVSIYKIMDKIMLGYLVDTTNVGYFENAEKIINIPLMLVTSLSTVMSPRMSQLVAQGKKKESERFIDISMQFVLWLSTAMCFGIVAISKPFVTLFLGDQFIKCIDLVIFFAPTLIAISWGSTISNQILLPNNKDMSYIKIVTFGALFNFITNLVLIPKLNADGAAITTLITEIIVLICYIVCVRKTYDWKKYLLNAVRYILCGILMFAVVYTIPECESLIITILLKCIVGAGIYIILTLMIIKKYNKLFFNSLCKLLQSKVHFRK